jgi:hypothetical protein
MTIFFLLVVLFLFGLVGWVFAKIAEFLLYFIAYGLIFSLILMIVMGVI